MVVENHGEISAHRVRTHAFTANYVATGQTVVHIATTLLNLLPSLNTPSA